MSEPRFSSIAACFAVADVGATMRWYEEHLGFNGHPDWEFEVKDPNGYVLVFSELTD
jgi:catechol 2,3-dioxygenase-like lactoylglutathione lyase family enzyme